ncbi:hypothetical protein cypCar_00019823 [Cyprinus carpio]|nr:hypothetical protein cypCar_00019823 [Cyprinus carpio]
MSECNWMHSEAKTFGQQPGVKKGAAKKPLLSRKNIMDRLIFSESFALYIVEDESFYHEKDEFVAKHHRVWKDGG